MQTCIACSSNVPIGSRWCPTCQLNMAMPAIGRLASPFKRLAAHLIDALLIGLVMGFLSVAIPNESLRIAAVILLVAYAVWALLRFARGSTPGKGLVGLEVVKRDGQKAGLFTMLIRETIGKLISSSLFSLGLIWILVDDENQGWHDKFMNTYVVETSSGMPPPQRDGE